jgi:hypothetical protein
MNDEFPFCEVSEAGKQACQASVIVGKIEICSAIDNFVSQCKLLFNTCCLCWHKAASTEG